MSKLLGFLLGAGQGVIGSVIRTGLATAGGYFVTKGWLDTGTVTNLTTTITGLIMTGLAGLGSHLNNKAL
jgi:hypothetical protein